MPSVYRQEEECLPCLHVSSAVLTLSGCGQARKAALSVFARRPVYARGTVFPRRTLVCGAAELRSPPWRQGQVHQTHIHQFKGRFKEKLNRSNFEMKTASSDCLEHCLV